MKDPLSPKQLEFIDHSTKQWNIAHGAVSTGKTIATLFRFMQAVSDCPDSQIFMVGHSSDTIYRNAIRLLLESEELKIFRPFCHWLTGKRQLKFKNKIIQTLGAKDEGAIGAFQGLTASLMYCDEMTLYPEPIIDMIDTRLRKEHSMGFAAMNPSHPNHKCKQWIDWAAEGNEKYYALHFVLDDNPFLTEEYKERVRNSASGLFYKRNVLGLWVMAEGAIFDFFDKKIYVQERAPACADYWIAGIDYGASNPFCCLLIGVCIGEKNQQGKQLWVEKEYYWDHKRRPKVNTELADDMAAFLEPYGVKMIYLDPSAESFQNDLQRRGMHVVHAKNDVFNGIQKMTDMVRNGQCIILKECVNLVREIEGYVWDSKAAKKGYDQPLKQDDHCVDALRYALYSHKIAEYSPYKEKTANDYLQNRFQTSRRF
jgi:PBSX family phage terminase large subunit